MPPHVSHMERASEKLRAFIPRSRSTSPAPSKADLAGVAQSRSTVRLDKDLPALPLAAVPQPMAAAIPVTEKLTDLTSHVKQPADETLPSTVPQNARSQPTSLSISATENTVLPTAIAPSVSVSEVRVSTEPAEPSSVPKDDAPRLVDLWDTAYESLRKDEPKVVEAYEHFLFNGGLERSGTRAPLVNIGNASGVDRQKQLKDVLDSQQAINEQTRWEFTVWQKNIVVQEEVNRITRAVIWAKSFIGTVASNEPHAALAWAGVSLLLPLLLNPTKQDQDAIKGLDCVCTLLLRYRVLEKVYLMNGGAEQKRQGDLEDLHSHFRINTVNLYRQILGFQFRLATHYCKKTGSKYLSNLFLSDNWKELLDEINASVVVGEDDLMVLDRDRNLQTREAIKDLSKDQTTRLGQILRQLEEDRSVQQSEKFVTWLNDLFKYDVDNINSIHNFNMEKRQKVETGKWFIDEIKSWLREDTEMVYWRRGIPGVGKTMMMCNAIDHIKSNLSDLALEGVAYVYFQWDQQTSQTESAIYTSILQKIRASAGSLCTSLQELYRKHSASNTKPSAEELAKLLTDHKRDSSPRKRTTEPCGRILLMFDALDEARLGVRTALIKMLNSLDQETFRVVITSREDLDISTKDNMTRADRIKANSADMACFLVARLLQLRSDLNTRKNFDLVQALVADIRENAQGIFLRASLRADNVGSLRTEKEMREVARQPFGDLKEMYDKTLSQIKAHNKESPHAISALSWLTFAKRTLRSDELTEALAIQRLGPGNTQLNRQSVPTPEVIVRMCRGLITLDKSSRIMRLAHQTVQEYLRDLDETRDNLVDISSACFTSLTLRQRSDWFTVGKEFERRDFQDQASSIVDDGMTEEDNVYEEAEIIKLLESKGTAFTTSATHSIDADDDTDELDAYLTTASEAEDPKAAEESEDGYSVHSSYSRTDDDLCSMFGSGYKLDTWAAQPGEFAQYSGRFAVYHFAQLTEPLGTVLDALWKFLTERPSVQLFPLLLKGTNAYRAKFTPLHMAAVVGDVSTCERLLQQGIGINLQDISGLTPLMYAARNAHISLTEMLLDNGSDCSITDGAGKVAFQIVGTDMPKRIFRKMIPEGFVFEQSTLAFAVEGRLNNLVKLILELQVIDVDATDEFGKTALMNASSLGDLEAVGLLLDGGADIDRADNNEWTSLHLAAHEGQVKVVKFLLGAKADPHRLNKSFETPLLEAVEGLNGHGRENDTVLVAYFLLRNNASVAVKNFWGGTALHIAATTGSVKLVDLLLKARCELHALEHGGRTALHMALRTKPVPKFINKFIEAEVRLAANLGDPTSVAYRGKNSEGDTPLHMVARTRSHDVVSQLLSLPGTRIDDRNFAGRTAIYCAMHPRGADVFRTLLEAGASTDVVDYSDMSLLDSALGFAPSQVIGTLVQRSCPSHFPWDQSSETIQAYANESWYPQLLGLLSSSPRDDTLAYCNHIYSTREDEISVNQFTSGKEPYLEVRVPEESSTVRQVKFQMVSHDQGYSHESSTFGGTYENSFTWFEARIKPSLTPLEATQPKSETRTREIQHNVHASWEWSTHVRIWNSKSREPGTKEWLAMLQPGDKILVYAVAVYPGWINYVRYVRVDVYYETQESKGVAANDDHVTTRNGEQAE